MSTTPLAHAIACVDLERHAGVRYKGAFRALFAAVEADIDSTTLDVLTDLACFQAGDVPRDVAIKQARSRLEVDTATCSMESARAYFEAAKADRIAAFAALPWPKP